MKSILGQRLFIFNLLSPFHIINSLKWLNTIFLYSPRPPYFSILRFKLNKEKKMSDDSFLHWDAGLKIPQITVHLIMHGTCRDKNLPPFQKFVPFPIFRYSSPFLPDKKKNHGFCKFPPFFLMLNLCLTFTIYKLFFFCHLFNRAGKV